MRKYITYQRIKANENFYLDPNTNGAFEQATENSKFNETPYEHNWVFLWHIEYPDATPQEVIGGLLEEYKDFHFTFITEVEANTFLAQIWDVTVKDYIFTDNREGIFLTN